MSSLRSLSPTEFANTWQKLISDTSLPLSFLIILGENDLNSVEVVLWLCIFSLYTALRICVSAAHTRLEMDTAAEVDRLLWSLVVFAGVFVGFTVWVFGAVGVSLMLLMHYEVYEISLEAAGLLARKYSISLEIVLFGVAHAVALCQWAQFLVTYTSFLGFPIQIFLFYKLARVVQKLQEDIWRYRGFHHSTQALLQKCPPLSRSELSDLGDERCCMCWEGLKELPCSRLPCRHVHHMYSPPSDCLRRLMMASNERKCPLCKQVFLESADHPQFLILNITTQRGIDTAVTRVREVVPHAEETTVRRLLMQTRSINATIASLMEGQ